VKSLSFRRPAMTVVAMTVLCLAGACSNGEPESSAQTGAASTAPPPSSVPAVPLGTAVTAGEVTLTVHSLNSVVLKGNQLQVTFAATATNGSPDTEADLYLRLSCPSIASKSRDGTGTGISFTGGGDDALSRLAAGATKSGSLQAGGIEAKADSRLNVACDGPESVQWVKLGVDTTGTDPVLGQWALTAEAIATINSPGTE
jgi:hypothetical protein